jgi:hypothetical protein
VSKCKTVQDEKKVNKLSVRTKNQDGTVIGKRAIKSTKTRVDRRPV